MIGVFGNVKSIIIRDCFGFYRATLPKDYISITLTDYVVYDYLTFICIYVVS